MKHTTRNSKRVGYRKVLCALVGCLGLACLSPAPINTSNARHGIEHEKSEQQRALDQQHVQIGEVGSTPESTSLYSAPKIEGDSGGDKAVLAANKKGEDAIKTASADIKKEKGSFNWFWGLLVLAGALTSVQAFKAWANKALPDAPGTHWGA
jgi:hypothetical protein